MIYTDTHSVDDREECPGKRTDSHGNEIYCINCGYKHFDHVGWRCPPQRTSYRNFNDLKPNQRYLTSTMHNSKVAAVQTSSNAATMCAACRYAKIAHSVSTSGNLICPTYGRISYWTEPGAKTSPIQKSQPKEVDISDWRAWAHNRPGECACGIPRERCTYHK